MKKIYILILLITVSPLLMQCADKSNAESANVQAERAVPVRTAPIELQSFSNFLKVTGTVSARNHIEIVVEEPGILTRVVVDKGRYANKGDTLAILENKVLEAGYQQARAALQQAELEYNSRKVLYEKRAISENEYLGAKYGLDAAKAAYDLARVRYEKLFITAPLRGVVNDRYYDLGAYANAMTPIFEFIDNEVMKIRAGVAERYMGDISVGTPVTLSFDAYPQMNVESKVSFVSRSIEPGNRTFEIEVQVPNPERKLAPQMVANLTILRQTFQNRVVVPLDALIESEKGWYVYIAQENRAKKVPVIQEAIYENSVLVDGLSPDQQLIVVGQRNLSDGDLLEVVKN